MTEDNINDNIYFSLDNEIDDNIEEYDKEDNFFLNISNEIHNELNNNFLHEDLILPKIVDYQLNYTLKELLVICDYYGMAKELKYNKCNKDQIIHFLIEYESNDINKDTVLQRKNMWFYMNELKNDKFMKKYILW